MHLTKRYPFELVDLDPHVLAGACEEVSPQRRGLDGDAFAAQVSEPSQPRAKGDHVPAGRVVHHPDDLQRSVLMLSCLHDVDDRCAQRIEVPAFIGAARVLQRGELDEVHGHPFGFEVALLFGEVEEGVAWPRIDAHAKRLLGLGACEGHGCAEPQADEIGRSPHVPSFGRSLASFHAVRHPRRPFLSRTARRDWRILIFFPRAGPARLP